MQLAATAILIACSCLAPCEQGTADDAALRHARDLLARLPLVDGHNDLPWVIREEAQGDLLRYDIRERRATGDTDIPRLREGLVGGQFWSVWIPSGLPSRRARSSSRSTSRGG
jgi:hypothetical protein